MFGAVRTNIHIHKGEGERIVYLDYDGVLHHENLLWNRKRGPYLVAPPGHTVFQHSHILSKALEAYPEIKIVLSTTWVRKHGFHRTVKRLPIDIRERVIGSTWHSSNKPIEDEWKKSPRGMQVWGDVVRRKPSAWIAIDDDYLHWPKWAIENLVETDPVLGISKPDVEAVLKKKLEWLNSQSR